VIPDQAIGPVGYHFKKVDSPLSTGDYLWKTGDYWSLELILPILFGGQPERLR
jgi:hypothetical protein